MAQATLNGTLIDDGGQACDCGFEWGETTAYGNTTPTESKTTGQTFSQVITGLSVSTLYYFRAIATNGAGTSYGEAQYFVTLSPRTTVAVKDTITLESIRNVEMVAMGRFRVDKEGNAVYRSRYARNV